MHAGMRSLVQENSLSVDDLIMPLFVKDGDSSKEEIASMPGQYRYNLNELVRKVQELKDIGIKAVALFPALDESKKNEECSEALNPDGLYLRTIRRIKSEVPKMLIMTDIALDPYSSAGHDGFVDKESGEILNDETIEFFKKMAVAQASAGADILGPSDMMDGRVRAIRDALETNGYSKVMIMSYCLKYASSFYGPFRDALDSAPKAGDKKSYQMDFHNSSDIDREILLDEEEGADILMVKPGIAYLDIVARMSEKTKLPVAAYNVSGEYAMIKAASEKGWLDEEKVVYEMLISFKRAGASIILTYFAEEMARRLNKA